MHRVHNKLHNINIQTLPGRLIMNKIQGQNIYEETLYHGESQRKQGKRSLSLLVAAREILYRHKSAEFRKNYSLDGYFSPKRFPRSR